jgi:hypothetical protein
MAGFPNLYVCNGLGQLRDVSVDLLSAFNPNRDYSLAIPCLIA